MPSWLYLWPTVAFATAMLLNTVSWLFETRTAKKQLCFMAVYISGVAFWFSWLSWRGHAPIYLSAAGRPTSLMRCARRGAGFRQDLGSGSGF